MNIIKEILLQLKEHLNLAPDKENEQTVIENVRRAVEFRGVNLWILIFAVFIASIGLNIDSTPIIIGAMLISPLMGPIIGTGLAVGINDMELMKRSMHNLITAALFAIVAATIYFWISPLNEAQSELLARTSPTLYDVMIAIIGGASGFLALSTTGNHIQVVIGVAISTALLPPLCTVGFGIATGNWLYSLGALYLFFINSVFIAISTFLSVRIFNFSPKSFSDKKHERHVRHMLILISTITLLPSVILTYNIVRKTIYMQNAGRFIANELNFPGTETIEKEVSYKQRKIETVIIGNYIPPQMIDNARSRLSAYHLKGTELTVLQDGAGRDSLLLRSLRGDIINELYYKSESESRELKKEITMLRDSLSSIYRYQTLEQTINREARIAFPNIGSIAIGYIWEREEGDKRATPLNIAYITLNRMTDRAEKQRITDWLQQRMGEDEPIKTLFNE